MTLEQSLLMLIWVFIGGLLISKFTARQRVRVFGRRRERWSIVAVLLFLSPLLYWCATRSLYIGDTAAYYTVFSEAPDNWSEIISFAATQKKDHFFYGLLAFGRALFGTDHKLTFGLIALIQLLCLGLIYRKYSRNIWISIFLFVASTDYFAWMYNGIRQFTAATIGFTAFPFIVKKKYIPSMLIVLLASSFHKSALIMLPVIFIVQGSAWNRKTLFIALCSVVAVAFIDQLTGFLDSSLRDTQYKNVVSDWTEMEDDGTHFLRVLVYSVPTIIAFFRRKTIIESNNTMIDICVNMSIISSAIYFVSMFTSGIFIGRLPIYFSLCNYILLPWELRYCFKKDSRFIVTVAMVGFYSAFYIYSMR